MAVALARLITGRTATSLRVVRRLAASSVLSAAHLAACPRRSRPFSLRWEDEACSRQRCASDLPSRSRPCSCPAEPLTRPFPGPLSYGEVSAAFLFAYLDETRIALLRAAASPCCFLTPAPVGLGQPFASLALTPSLASGPRPGRSPRPQAVGARFSPGLTFLDALGAGRRHPSTLCPPCSLRRGGRSRSLPRRASKDARESQRSLLVASLICSLGSDGCRPSSSSHTPGGVRLYYRSSSATGLARLLEDGSCWTSPSTSALSIEGAPEGGLPFVIPARLSTTPTTRVGAAHGGRCRSADIAVLTPSQHGSGSGQQLPAELRFAPPETMHAVAISGTDAYTPHKPDLIPHLRSWPRPCLRACLFGTPVGRRLGPVSTARPLRPSPARPRCVTLLRASWAFTHPPSPLVSAARALRVLLNGSGKRVRAYPGNPSASLHALPSTTA